MNREYQIANHVIVGSGLTGLFLAGLFKKKQKPFTLIDQRPHTGGSRQVVEGFPLEWQLIPTKENLPGLLNEIKTSFFPNLSWVEQELSVVRWQKGQFKEFHGFGEEKFPGQQIFQELITGPHILLRPTLSEWIDTFVAEHQEDFLSDSVVTELECQGDQIHTLEINHHHKFPVDSVYFTPSPVHLLSLLPGPQLSSLAALLKKRNHILSALTYEFSLTERGPLPDLFFLGDEKKGLWLGHLREQDDTSTARFLTFLPYELEQEPEEMATYVRRLRRDLNKIEPDFFSKVTYEKLSLHPGAAGNLQPLAKKQTWQGLKNLKVYSHLYRNSFHPLDGIAEAWEWAVETAITPESSKQAER